MIHMANFSCEECERRLVQVENNIKDNIDELKKIRDFKEDYSIKTAQLVIKVDNLTDEVKKLCDKLSIITDKSGQDYDSIKKVVITAIITGIIAFVFAKIGLK